METCLVFTFHSPLQLSDYSFFDIGKKKSYFDEKYTYQRFKSNYKSIFLPALKGIVDLLSRREFKCSIYFSGAFLAALDRTDQEMLDKLKKLVKDGKITLLGGTSHESIACLFSKSLFESQLLAHKKLVKRLFGISPTVFNNTENIHFNDLIPIIEKHGYKALITEALTWYLHNHSPFQLFKAAKSDIAVFINQSPGVQGESGTLITRQIDPMLATYNNWKDHILNIIKQSDSLITLDEALKKYKAEFTYSIPMPIGRKRTNVGVASFSENAMQKEVITKLKILEGKVETKKNKEDLLYELSKFTSGDYFLDMNYKSITSPDKQPYDYYISMMNMLSDFEIRLEK
ncbi:hypothetical protein [Fulvivirga ligni]|uniref:hypothetical protein n=1 Tax=Fulvivirga ligni TaxID=2904246 RepID=UPI001F370C1C|nr:hypothetical protein [Fulvivirga ligni]UII19817.1 hypothetical protein LVD16_18405 [Fulvivirga ligni]